MPEATVLYSVIAVVVLGLIVWVAVVLKTAREPWARELAKAEPPSGATAALDADETARATPLALASDAKVKAAEERKDDNPGEKKAEV